MLTAAELKRLTIAVVDRCVVGAHLPILAAAEGDDLDLLCRCAKDAAAKEARAARKLRVGSDDWSHRNNLALAFGEISYAARALAAGKVWESPMEFCARATR